MSLNPFGHIDLRVKDLALALPLYEALMPELGMSGTREGPGWKTFVGEGTPPAQAFLPIEEDPEHRPNANRIAFWAKSREEVERLFHIIQSAGATIESGPRECPEYSPTYYGLFFRDASDNPLEICHRLD